MGDWQIQKLTTGSDERRFHSHSYYDINIFDSDSRRIVGYQTDFVERPLTATDTVEIGVIDLAGDRSWQRVGESRAWSWQQGPMAQWVPGQSILVWNDRDGDQFVTRVFNLNDTSIHTLARPSYAVDPNGAFTLSLNMARLDTLRPGYGYADGAGAQLDKRRPRNDGVWRQDIAGGNGQLVLSLHRAVRFLYSQCNWRRYLGHLRRRYCYWFNHVKISPDGKRFTVKLRYRKTEGNTEWADWMGVSLTCNIDGSDLRLLTDATSHVIWFDNQSLYLWQRDGFYLYADEAPAGRFIRQIGTGLVEKNAHLRYLPGADSTFVFDTPYRENIDLLCHDERGDRTDQLAQFSNHRPPNGPYRCDLHPCPSPDGRSIVVTSLDDGGRQIYLLERDG